MVYEKSLRLSTYAMSGGMMTQGQITNHMSLDATNIQQFFNWGNELWTTPIKVFLHNLGFLLTPCGRFGEKVLFYYFDKGACLCMGR